MFTMGVLPQKRYVPIMANILSDVCIYLITPASRTTKKIVSGIITQLVIKHNHVYKDT